MDEQREYFPVAYMILVYLKMHKRRPRGANGFEGMSSFFVEHFTAHDQCLQELDQKIENPLIVLCPMLSASHRETNRCRSI